MSEAGEAATRRGCSMMDKDVDSDAVKLRKGGLELLALQPTMRAELAKINAAVSQEWAESLDKRGKPGSEVLKAYRAGLTTSR